MNGYRSKRRLEYLAGFDAAEGERQASLARYADNDAQLEAMFDEEARREPEGVLWTWTLRFLAASALVALFGLTA